MNVNTAIISLDWYWCTSYSVLCRKRSAEIRQQFFPSIKLTLPSPPRSFTQVRQWGELKWMSQLQWSGQQVFSAVMSKPISILIGQDWKGLLYLKHSSRCSPVCQYLPLSCRWTAPELSDTFEDRFTVFLKCAWKDNF